MKNITRYKGFPGEGLEHKSVQFFWRALESFTQEELSSYLKFVWGRSRLSGSQSDQHKISYVEGHSNKIPETHTCFFELDLFDYDSYEIFESKIKYGMKHCSIIVEDSNTLTLGFEFGY